MEGAAPVDNVQNSGRASLYRGTWIAECTIHRKIGSYINAYMKKKEVTEELYRQRAKFKMYKEGTTHKQGPNEIKHKQARKKIKDLETVLDKESLHLKRAMKHKLISMQHRKDELHYNDDLHVEAEVEMIERGEGELEEKNKVILEDIEATAAFLIFQFSERHEKRRYGLLGHGDKNYSTRF